MPSVTDHPITMCFALPFFISLLQAGRQAGDTTGETIRLAKCCNCALHRTCVYKWLAAQYDNYVPRDNWGCPHCLFPVNDLADNPQPCVICGEKELRAFYYKPVAQSIPCCNNVVHLQCLLHYIRQSFEEDRFPCPACHVDLAAKRTMSLHINAVEMEFSDNPVPSPPTPQSPARRRSSRIAHKRGQPLGRLPNPPPGC